MNLFLKTREGNKKELPCTFFTTEDTEEHGGIQSVKSSVFLCVLCGELICPVPVLGYNGNTNVFEVTPLAVTTIWLFPFTSFSFF